MLFNLFWKKGFSKKLSVVKFMGKINNLYCLPPRREQLLNKSTLVVKVHIINLQHFGIIVLFCTIITITQLCYCFVTLSYLCHSKTRLLLKLRQYFRRFSFSNARVRICFEKLLVSIVYERKCIFLLICLQNI